MLGKKQDMGEININNIISDINSVISKHFTNILNRYNSEKIEFEEFVKNIPIVKKIIKENAELKEQNSFLKKNLDSLGKKYTELFLSKNKVTISAKIDMVDDSSKIEKHKIKENIELVIHDNKNKESVDITDIEKEVEKSLEEKTKEMEKILNSNSFSCLFLDDDGEEYVVDEDEEEEDEEEEVDEEEDEEEEEVDEEEDDEEEEEDEKEEEDEEEEDEGEDEEEEKKIRKCILRVLLHHKKKNKKRIMMMMMMMTVNMKN